MTDQDHYKVLRSFVKQNSQKVSDIPLIKIPLTLGIIELTEIEVLSMVTEWEKEQLGRLTHQRLLIQPQQRRQSEPPAAMQPHRRDRPGRMTLQNLQLMKDVQNQSNTGGTKIKLLLERLRMALATSMSDLFTPSARSSKEGQCRVYGHNLPWGAHWEGEFPRCLDCNAIITEPSQLRGAVPLEERRKFRSYGEK